MSFNPECLILSKWKKGVLLLHFFLVYCTCQFIYWCLVLTTVSITKDCLVSTVRTVCEYKGRFLMPAVEAYNLDTRWGRVFSFAPHNRSGRFWGRGNILPLPRFKPRTVKPVASRNTNDSVLAPHSVNTALSVERSGRCPY